MRRPDEKLADALHWQAGGVHPQPALPEVLDTAHARRWLWPWALLTAIGLYQAATYQPVSDPTPTTSTRLLEA